MEKLLLELKKKFSRGDKESVKVAKLKKVEQKERTMEKFIQEFRRAARESRYQERALAEEFKREMNRVIRRKLMKVERPLVSIKQWYEHATNLNKHWRESKRKEKRLKERKESGNQGQRQIEMGNNQGEFRL